MSATTPVPGVSQRLPTTVYIDGFNFYYAAIKGTPYKWLNPERYFALLRPHDHIKSIKYFTALVSGSHRVRQEAYLNALGTLPLVDVILGKFKNKRVYCSEASCTHTGNRRFETVEKRTGVNIAVSMPDDAYQGACEQFVLVSGDSDLVPGVDLVRWRFPTKRIMSVIYL